MLTPHQISQPAGAMTRRVRVAVVQEVVVAGLDGDAKNAGRHLNDGSPIIGNARYRGLIRIKETEDNHLG